MLWAPKGLELLANRVATLENLPREGSVDDSDRLGFQGIRVQEGPPADEGDLEDSEIIVAFVAGPESSYIGTNLTVDGGMNA
jgi:hypothetical protein